MTSVFIGGSRRLGRLNAELVHRLNNIIERRLNVLIGDASGFDRAAQAHLAENAYPNVVVYCTAGECRNNLGNWPICAVQYDGADRDRQFYTAKDDAMLRDADFGFFAWDGKSKGTLRNVRMMAQRNRPSLVYVSPLRGFLTIRTPREAENLSQDLKAVNGVPAELFSEAWREATGATRES